MKMNYNEVNTLNNLYVVKFNRLTRDTMEIDGVEYKIDTRFNRQKLAQEIGVIAATTEEDDGIDVGDTVVCQYLVVEDKNRLSQDDTGYYQMAQRDQIFAIIKMNEEIKALDNFIFVRPEETDESDYETVNGLLVPKKEKKGRETIGTVTHIGDLVTNVKVGDRVKLHKSAQYPLDIDGVLHYRARSTVGLVWKWKN